MTMQFKIDIDDFWLDENDNLEKGLKCYITNSVTKQIYELIKQKINEEISEKLKQLILEKSSEEITKVIECGNVKSRISDKLISITEYVQECLSSSKNDNWHSFDKTIRDISDKFCNELKHRYDVSFASNIVAKLINNKIIKEDVVKSLLEKNT